MSSQFPLNMNHFSGSGTVRYVPDLNAFNHILQNLRRQGFNGRILADRRVHLPPLHALRKIPNLFKHIGVKHLMVNDVGLGADLRVPVMIGAEINICASVFEPLPGDGQRVAAAVAV